METIPLSEAKDRLSSLVDAVAREHERIEITRHGKPAAVLMSKDDLDALHETLFWLSTPGIREDVAEGLAPDAVLHSAEETRARYGVAPR
jgi:prevent-host-death family protein